jgi:uncharacterized protein YeaO (DUF488 family)
VEATRRDAAKILDQVFRCREIASSSTHPVGKRSGLEACRMKTGTRSTKASAGERVRAKRIYDDPDPDDGLRVLVDRLWPRGMSKARARIDRWAKEVSPTPELRKWYGHVPERFEEFARRYKAELRSGEARLSLGELRAAARRHRVTLLTASRDLARSEATVLASLLSTRRSRTSPRKATGNPRKRAVARND